MNTSRVIIHLDLDCYYAQVEQNRLNIPWEEPACVQQHQMLIAVNYAARQFGIKRGDSAATARLKCPQVHLMLTEIDHGKVSLKRYRDASEKIFNIIIREVGPTGIVERASVDEAYIDVTELILSSASGLAAASRSSSSFSSSSASTNQLDWENLGVILDRNSFKRQDTERQWTAEDAEEEEEAAGEVEVDAAEEELDDFELFSSIAAKFDGNDDDDDDDDDEECDVPVQPAAAVVDSPDVLARLHQGAKISVKIRQCLQRELNFSASCGISVSKILAKIGSGRNKPRNQTVILPSAAVSLLRELPFKKVPGLGGKLGKSLAQRFAVSTLGELYGVASIRQLKQQMGDETGSYLEQLMVYGNDERGVRKRERVKSCTTFKNFDRVWNFADIQVWMTRLATDICARLQHELDEFKRRATTLTIHYRLRNVGHTKVCETPSNMTNVEEVTRCAMRTLESLGIALFPCRYLGLVATNFVDFSQNQSITSFLTAKKKEIEVEAASLAERREKEKKERAVRNEQRLREQEQKLLKERELEEQREAQSVAKKEQRQARLETDVGASFASSSTRATSSSSAPDFTLCGECGKRMLPGEEEEHANFHVALKLSREINSQSINQEPRKKKRKEASEAPAKKKKKKAGETQKSLKAFLK